MSQPPRLIALVNVARLLGLGGLMLAACTGTVNVSGTGGGSATGAGGATDTAGSTGTAGRGAAGTGGSAGAPGAGVGGASGGNPGAGGRGTGGSTGTAGTSGVGGATGGGATMPSAGCGKPAALMNGVATISVAGTARQYTLKLPDNYDQNHPYKLIFGFHWLGGSMGAVVSGNIIGGPYYGLQSRSAGSAILVAPDGLATTGGLSPGAQGWQNTNGQDVAFVKAMLAQFEAGLCIDQSRIFSTGFSYGGIFSLLLGCQMSDVFRAIAPESGEFFGSCNVANARPVAVWQSQGDSDTTVDPNAAKMANDYFVTKNHCTTQTMPVSPSPCVAYQGCDAGYPVTWCEFSGGHMPWNMAPDPVWAFFNQF